MTVYRYTIDPRPADLGGGWRLAMFEDGDEVGGGVFPPAGQGEEALTAAYCEALEWAQEWQASRLGVW